MKRRVARYVAEYMSGILANGPEISDGRPDHGKAGSKEEDSRQKKPAAFRNFYVGRRPVNVKGFFCFPGRWNAISKTGSWNNVGITAFTPNYK